MCYQDGIIYIWLDCRDKHHDRVRAVSAVLYQDLILIDDTAEDVPSTFLGFDRLRLPNAAPEFPAFFMHRRRGVDKRITSLLRPLFNYGVRPDLFAKMLLELHTLEHARKSMFREHLLLAFQRKSVASAAHSIPDELFSDFGN